MSAKSVSALGVDELRALSRLAGWRLPAMLQADPAAGENDLAGEVVAVRCMLAHGVLRLTETGAGEQVEPAPGVREALAALTAPTLLVEIEVETAAQTGEVTRHVLAEGAGATLRLSEREPDVWSVVNDTPPAAAVVRGIVDAHTADCAPPAGVELELAVADHVRADALVLEGFADEVAPTLLAAGVPAEPARAWAAALTRRRGAGAVRVARRCPDGGQADVYAGGDVRWVAAGPLGLWQLDETPTGATRIHDVAPAAVQAAVASLLEER